MDRFNQVEKVPPSAEEIRQMAEAYCREHQEANVEEQIKNIERKIDGEMRTATAFQNDKYMVLVHKSKWNPAEAGGPSMDMIWLSIRRNDREPVTDWREFQQIKNELVGEENEGFEIYPAESRVVDQANQYHLWVFADPSVRIPVGFDNGRHVTECAGGKVRQRKFQGQGEDHGKSKT